MGPADVCNIALTEIGNQGLVSSISPSDGSAEGNAASILYGPKIDALHRSANWNFCRKQMALTLLRAVTINGVASIDPPPIPWLYEYLLPADCLKARYIAPITDEVLGISTPLTTATTIAGAYVIGGAIKFIVANDLDSDGNQTKVLLTNQIDAVLIYTGRVENPDLWDPMFLSAATATLGAWFANALGRNRELMQDQINIAMGLIAQARAQDGNEGITSVDNLPDWMRIRGFGPTPLDTNVGGDWDLVSWPNGTLV